MLNKKIKLFYPAVLLTLLLFLLLLTIGCEGKSGSLSPLDAPEVFITSYEGVESLDDLPEQPDTFRRRIFWVGNSNGGVIDGFRYRVRSVVNGEPGDFIQTAGTLIDEDEGWIYHYKPGADTDIPLTDPDVRSRWTKNVSDVIFFPSSTADGDSANVVSIFEIQCKDHRGQESPIVSRFFSVYSRKPGFDVTFADRFRPIAALADDPPNIKTIGLGLEVSFEITDHTPFIENFADYYLFRIGKRNIASGEFLPEYETEWYSTAGQRNVNRAWLNVVDGVIFDMAGRDDIFPILEIDQFQGPGHTNPITESILEVKAVNLAGVHSEPIKIPFRVYDDFETEARIYHRRINVLGANHYTTFQDASVTRPLPYEETADGVRYGTPFFVNSEGNYAAMNSNDIKVYLNWGWKGQYESDDPDQGFINEVHDRATGHDYLGNIVAFDLRMNNQPYYYPPLSDSPDYFEKYLFIDDDGLHWLRIPRTVLFDGRLLLTDVIEGQNIFEVKILDSQNKLSETTEFVFYSLDRVPRDQKEGILILDNDFQSFLDPLITEFYQNLLADYPGPVHRIDRREASVNWDPRLHYGRNVFAPTDLEPYKLVIYHCDVPTLFGPENANFHQEYGALNLYMLGGGNILLSAGQNLRQILNDARNQGWNTIFNHYMGIDVFNPANASRLSQNWYNNPFFVTAVSESNYPEMNVNLEKYIAETTQLSVLGGLGPITYFNEDALLSSATVVYRLGSKPVSTEPFHPNQEMFDQINNQPVAIRNQRPNNVTYTLGFPLSFMELDSAKAFMNVIIDDLGL